MWLEKISGSLDNFVHFIYWNMPFVFRVVFMGMETHGSAYENIDKVWIDPSDYVNCLEDAVQYLDNRGLSVSIYNLSHCVITKYLLKFARDSISTWKKEFLPECVGCSKVNVCAGVFATSKVKPKNIHKL